MKDATEQTGSSITKRRTNVTSQFTDFNMPLSLCVIITFNVPSLAGANFKLTVSGFTIV